MIQLNLLPDLKKEYIKTQKSKALVISVSILVTLGAVGISALLFLYVTFVQQFQINLASDSINSKMQQLKAIPDINKYITVQNQLASLPDLHNNSGQYSRLLEFLSTLNPGPPNNITLSNLQLVGDDKTITLTGTTGSFESLNVFVDTLKNAQISYKANGQGDPTSSSMFSQVLVQTADLVRSNSATVVGFTINTTYNDPVFNVGNTDMSVKIPSITTTPSVTQSPNPSSQQQLFNGKSGGQ